MSEKPESEYYGIAAEYATPAALLAAVRRLRGQNIGLIDAFSPLPIPGMDAAVDIRGASLSSIAVGGALLGGFGCFAMIVYATIVGYPFQIAGRPLFSWPYYLIPSFASAMMVAAVLVFVAMLFLGRLPRLNHPVFNIDGIGEITQDRLFLVVEARTEDFDASLIERELNDLPVRPLRIQQVPR